jgi:hypothetical protein
LPAAFEDLEDDDKAVAAANMYCTRRTIEHLKRDMMLQKLLSMDVAEFLRVASLWRHSETSPRKLIHASISPNHIVAG